MTLNLDSETVSFFIKNEIILVLREKLLRYFYFGENLLDKISNKKIRTFSEFPFLEETSFLVLNT